MYEGIAAAQRAAIRTVEELNERLVPGMSEREVDRLAEKILRENGIRKFWYHDIACLTLIGGHSAVSVGGSEYDPGDDIVIGENDVITLDLSPAIGLSWGDYARTLFMENGRMCPLDKPSDPDFREGLELEIHLHDLLIKSFDPDMTFEEVYCLINAEITSCGFRNLDFRGNLGHTIETAPDARRYLEKGNKLTFREAGRPFTLEPHIASSDRFGFKRENIYVFADGRLAAIDEKASRETSYG